MAGYHRHKDLKCVECGVVVYASAACVMWNRDFCMIRHVIYCNEHADTEPHTPKCACQRCLSKYGPPEERGICYVATQSIPDTGESTGHNDPEVGVHIAINYESRRTQHMVAGNVRDILPNDVPNAQEDMDKEQAKWERTTHYFSR